MPRPGPRPYECVRRAWHSDRHQPMRGSLIQEIFRLVNEVHAPSTKKNKEWQEKLPVVVLKAEEIIYSKANSEAEYMDLKTLWDRCNDAINTIIRRDETTETGDLLQPCIEAALNLGCTPGRTSRSQRNCNPRCYLTPSGQQPNSLPASMPNQTNNLHCMPNYSNIVKPNSTCLGSDWQTLAGQNIGVTSTKFLSATDTGRLSNCHQSFPLDNNYPTSNLCAVFPLYYGSCLESPLGLGIIPESASSTLEPHKVCVGQNMFSFDEDAAVKLSQPDIQNSRMKQRENGCDLSLRLGSLSAPLPGEENGKHQDVEALEGFKLKNPMAEADEKLSCHTRMDTGNPLDSYSRKSSENENMDVIMKKRKAGFSQAADDQAYCWQRKLSGNDLTHKMKNGGL